MASLIDFNEVTDHQDWERFAMAFVQLQGLEIVERCAVGPDGGRDFIAVSRNSFGGAYRWLVSCKHRRSGTVGVGDDEAKANKLREFRCNGFMFVYSRPISQGLLDSFERVRQTERVDLHVLTDREIENFLVANSQAYLLIRQYFPRSWERLSGVVTVEECDCGNYSEDIYLIPFNDLQTRQVEHMLCCGACGSYKIQGLDEAGVNYGPAIQVRFES